jgi:transposase-like protein
MGAMKIKSCSRQYLSAAEKAELVAAYERSGLSQRDFASRMGIAVSNLGRWVRNSQEAGPGEGRAALVEVPNLLASGPGSRAYRLHFSKGLMLEVAGGFEPDEVRVLAQLVQSL